MPIPPKAAIVGIAVAVIAAAGVGAVFLVDDDDGDEREQAASTTTSGTEVTTTTSLPPETTTTTAASTTTTTRAARTTTTRAATTTTAGGSTTTVATASCGTGKATVSFAAKDLRTDAQSSTFIPQAVVDNGVNAPIEVEEIVIEVVYPDNVVRTVRFPTAGTTIAPGTTATFEGERLTTTKRYDSVRITRFTYFTAGRRNDCRVSAP